MAYIGRIQQFPHPGARPSPNTVQRQRGTLHHSSTLSKGVSETPPACHCISLPSPSGVCSWMNVELMRGGAHVDGAGKGWAPIELPTLAPLLCLVTCLRNHYRANSMPGLLLLQLKVPKRLKPPARQPPTVPGRGRWLASTSHPLKHPHQPLSSQFVGLTHRHPRTSTTSPQSAGGH